MRYLRIAIAICVAGLVNISYAEQEMSFDDMHRYKGAEITTKNCAKCKDATFTCGGTSNVGGCEATDLGIFLPCASDNCQGNTDYPAITGATCIKVPGYTGDCKVQVDGSTWGVSKCVTSCGYVIATTCGCYRNGSVSGTVNVSNANCF